MAGLPLTARAGQVVSTWLKPADGDWTTASNWSTAPNDPNNGTPAGTTYAANISAAGSAYTVGLTADVTVDALSLNSADATLSHTAGVLTVNAATVAAGTYALNGGTLAATTLSLQGGAFNLDNGGTVTGATISLQGGALNLLGGTLSNVAVTGGTLTVATEAHVTGTLSVTAAGGGSGGTVTVGSGADLTFDGPSPALAKGTVTGAGLLYLNTTSPGTPTTTTIGAAGGLSGTVGVYQLGDGNTLSNAGTIDANDAAGGTLALYPSTFVNRGLAEATNGGTLSISPDQSLDNSAGTILAGAGSTVDLYGSFNTAALGTINGSAGTVAIGGTANNAGGTLTLSATTGNVVLGGTLGGGAGTILGGTVAQTGGATLNVSNGVLSGVRVTGGDLAVGSGGSLLIRNGIAVDDGRLDLSTAAYLGLGDRNPTLDNLTVTATGLYATLLVNAGGSAAGPGTLTLGPHGTLVGPLSVQESTTGNTLVNQGTIDADATTTAGVPLTILTSYFSNAGLAEATAGGTLDIEATVGWNGAGGSIVATGGGTVLLGGTFTTAGLAIDGSGGTVVINGTANNANATLTLTPTTGNVVLNGSTATVSGGTIAGAGGAVLNVSTGTLAGVTVAGPAVAVGPGGFLTVTGGLAGSGGGVVALGSSASLTFPAAAGGQAVAGLTVTGTDPTRPAGVLVYAGVTQSATSAFTGAVGLSVVGTGTTVLAGHNTYTAGTTITAASRAVATVRADNAAGSLGSGTTYVGAGGVLAGVGTTGGAVEVAKGGTVTGGTGATAADAVGTLTTGAQTWDGGGTLYVKVNPGTVAGSARSPSAGNPSADRLVLSGLAVAATTGNKFTVDVVGLGSSASATQLAAGGELVLATVQGGTPGSITAALAKLSLTTANLTVPSGSRLAEEDVGTDVDLVVTAAPEPTSLLLAAAACGLCLTRRRDRARA